MKWLLNLLSQPSTGAGLSALIGVVYSAIYSGMPLTVAAPAALGALYAMLKHESGSESK